MLRHGTLIRKSFVGSQYQYVLEVQQPALNSVTVPGIQDWPCSGV